MKKSSATAAAVVIAIFAAWMGFDPGKPKREQIESTVQKTIETWTESLPLGRISSPVEVLSRDVVAMTIDRSFIARKPSDGSRIRVWPVTATVLMKSKVTLNNTFTTIAATDEPASSLRTAPWPAKSIAPEEAQTYIETRSLLVWKDADGSWRASVDAIPSSWTKVGYFGIGVMGL